MSDEIRRIRGLRDDPEVTEAEDADLTTADLAGARRSTPEAANDDSIIDAEVESVEIQSGPVAGDRNVPVASSVSRAATRATGTQAVAAVPVMEREAGPLFSGDETKNLRARWDTIQVGFVDEPRQAVEQADNLVAGTMKRLAEIFAEERGKLEGQWDKGENVSTEDLRLALRRYRSFFSSLLAI